MNKIVIANLKMNLDYEEAKAYVEKMGSSLFHNIDLFIAPSSLYLDLFKKTYHKICAQNVYCRDKGSFTGEISPKQLKSFGINYAIVGHSERRHNFYEDDNMINAKVISCLSNGITPILCVGDSLAEKDNANEVIIEQLSNDLFDVKNINNLIIAYEPVWSIGTGIVPKGEEIEERIAVIKQFIHKRYKTDIKVLYGGSVNRDNIYEIIGIKNVDGVLVGGSSIDPDYFKDMLVKI